MRDLPWQDRPLEAEVQDYLDQLLRKGVAASPPPARPFPAALAAAAPEKAVENRRRIAAPRAAVALADPPARLIPVLPPPAKASPAPAKPSAPGPPAEAPRPAWQQREFEVLRFQVGGLTLAVPLVLLGSIHPLEEQPAPLPGQADWCLGVLPGREPARRVVDTARVIMPERYHPGMRESYRYVLTVHESRWALAAEAITGTEVLAREQVRWRTRSGRRPWLAGTVIDHMCALIDVAGLDALLTTGAGQNSTDRGSKT